jgi:hypothetical protein
MTEDELLQGVTDALSAGGWYWHHVRRADRAVTMGTPGFPDVLAVHPDRRLLIAIECKAEGGRFRPGQWDWIRAFAQVGERVDGRVVTPESYDDLIYELIGDRLAQLRGRGTI